MGRRDLMLVQVGLYSGALAWLVLATSVLSGYGQSSAAFALAALPILLLVSLRPNWVSAATPWSLVVVYSGLQLGVYLVAGVLAAAWFVAWLRSTARHRSICIVPLLLAAFVAAREYLDPFGDTAFGNHLGFTVLGLVAASLAILAAPSVYGFLLNLAFVGGLYAFLATSSGVFTDVGRWQSVLGLNANGVGSVAALGALASLVLVLHAPWGKWRLSLLGLCLLGAMGVVESGSQGAVLALGVGLLVIGVQLRRSASAGVLFAGAAVVVATAAWLMDGESSRFADAGALAESRELRLALIDAGTRVFLDSPLFGAGRAPVEYAMATYTNAVSDPHNVYIEVLAVGGLLGAFAWVVFLIFSLWGRGSASTRVAVYPILIALGAIAVGFQLLASPLFLVAGVALGALMAEPRDETVQRQSEAFSTVPPRPQHHRGPWAVGRGPWASATPGPN